MPKTYISYFNSDQRGDFFTYQAALMLVLITDGPLLTRRQAIALISAVDHQALAAGVTMAAGMCERKGWINRPRRGVYRLTASGRRTWEPLLSLRLEEAR